MIKEAFYADGVLEQKGRGLGKKMKTPLVQIALKLAERKGYNDNGEIRGPGGDFIADTDVAQLLVLALSPLPFTRGKEEFAALLSSAGVDPALIANEDIRRMMAGANTGVSNEEPGDSAVSMPSPAAVTINSTASDTQPPGPKIRIRKQPRPVKAVKRAFEPEGACGPLKKAAKKRKLRIADSAPSYRSYDDI